MIRSMKMAAALILILSLVTGYVPNDQSDIAISEEECCQYLLGTDYLSLGERVGFSSAAEVEPWEVFNLFAATPMIQKRMDEKDQILAEGYGYVAIRELELHSFAEEYFGDREFDLTALLDHYREGDRLIYDKEKKILYLSLVNGGVNWPSAVPFTLEIKEICREGDEITVTATRHYSDNAEIDVWYQEILTLIKTDKGFRYHSYVRSELK